MAWRIAFIIGAVIGAGTGFATERIDVHPVVASVVSAAASLILGMIAMLVVWHSRSGGFGSGFLAIGLDNLLWLLIFLGAVLALHVALGFVPEPVRSHRPVILGAVGGVCGAVSVAWLMTVAANLR